MRAIVQTGPEEIEVRERGRPTPAAGEVLVRVGAAGLCGSDVHAYRYEGGYEWIPMPRIMGHEYAGTVEALGDGVDAFDVGRKVVEMPIHSCGTCFQCRNGQPNVCQHFTITGMHRDGAFTEYRTVPEEYLVGVPDEVPLEHAAITEPTSVATRAVCERSAVKPGDRVLVEGPGPIGVLTAAIAAAQGASVLVSGLGKDANYRLPLVDGLGIDTVDVNSESLDDRATAMTDGVGFDVVFDTTGHKSGPEIAVDQVRKGGQVVVVGLPGEPSELFMTPVVRGEVEVTTSYASVWGDFNRALRLMAQGVIEPGEIIDTSYSVDDPRPAIEAFLDSDTLKPVFSFDGT